MLSALFLFILQTNLLFSSSQPTICLENNGNYTLNSTYADNLDTALSSIPANIGINGFYNASAGSHNPDIAYAIALCRGDTQPDVCRRCIQNFTAGLRTECPNQRQAIQWKIHCMLRYSNQTMLGIMETRPAILYICNTENATNPDEFKRILRTHLDNLRARAANGGPLRKVAAGNVTANDSQYIFAMVQCTPDLSSDDCSTCLIDAAAEIPTYCDRRRGGRILFPSCNLRYEKETFFNETRIRELDPVPLSPASQPSLAIEPPGEGGRNTNLIVVFVVIPIVAFAILLSICVAILLRGRRKRKLKKQLEIEGIPPVKSLKYSLRTIKIATTNFSNDAKLGEGGFGAVYKGKLTDGGEIAVKRLAQGSKQGNKEFKNEVILLANHQHKNLVRLLGYCVEGNERLLVYEFVQNSSLDLFIFDAIKRSSLDWIQRFEIIIGIAKGIRYLHEDSELKIIHRDLKPNNVLLDGDMIPKIADFGMARLFEQDETRGNTSKAAGTKGYMAPEYIIHGQFSVKSDVFSFGVMVLEIITGRRNRCRENEENLLTSVWKNWCKGTSANVVDPVMRSISDFSVIIRCIRIGLLCVQENEANRPTMNTVLLMFDSFYTNLATPLKPAFFMPGDYDDSNITPLPNHNLEELEQDPTRNDISVSEFYPR